MYGMLVMLEHRRTGKLIISEESGSGLKLDKQISKRAHFRIVAFNRKTMEGEKVCLFLMPTFLYTCANLI